MREQSYTKNNSHQNNIKGGETKIMKKVLNVLLILALIFTMSAPAFAATTPNTQAQFDELKAAGVLDGDANGNMLALDSQMDRQQLAKIACQLAGVAPTPGVEVAAFADDYKYQVWGFDQGWIQAAYNSGLMIGKGDAGFDAKGTVSYAELLAVIIRSMGTLAAGVDETKNPWYTDYMTIANQQGMVVAGAFAPTDAAVYMALVAQTYNSYQYNMAPAELAVSGITVVDAKTLQVNFTQAVDPSAIGTGALRAANYTINGTALTGADILTKSADNKTITIKLGTLLTNNTSYAVVVQNIKSQDLTKSVPMYSQVINYLDLVKPAVTSVSYVDNVTVKVTFSEAMSTFGSVSYKTDAGVNSTTLFGPVVASADMKSFTVKMAGTGTGVVNGINYTMQILGASDLSGNIQTVNPFTTTVVKNVTETVLPTLNSITSPNSNTLVISYSEKVTIPGTVTIGSGGTPLTINLTPDTGNAVANATGDVVTVTVPALNLGAVTADGVYNVVVANFIDTNGNETLTQTKVVTMKKDATAPAYVSSEVADIGGIKYLVITFDESALSANFINTIANLNGTRIDSQGIQTTLSPAITAIGNTTVYNPTAAATVNAIKIDLSGVATGNYTVTLPAGFVKDDLANLSLAKQFSFNLGATTADSTKPSVTGVTYQTASNNVVQVIFTEAMDMATALNVANYTVDGVAAFESAVFITNATTVQLTLKADAISATGSHLFTVLNVKDLAGNVVNASNTTLTGLKETVTPKITKAELTGADKITVTFSEPLAAAPDAADLAVLVGGVAETGYSFATVSASVYTITLSNALTSVELASEILVKTQTGVTVADAAGNAMLAQTVTVIK